MRYLIFAFQCYYPGGGFNDVVHVGCDEAEAVSVWRQLEKYYYDFIHFYRISADYGFSILLEEYVPTDHRVDDQFTNHSDLVARPHVWVEVKWETLEPQPS